MKEGKEQKNNGYYLYQIIAVIVGFLLVGFIFYLSYDLFLKLTTQEITNGTLIQAIVTLVITIFIGGFFTKWLELRNNKKLEYFKTEKEIATRIIDLSGSILRNEDVVSSKNKLILESYKAELFFDNEISNVISNLSKNVNEENLYKVIIVLKKHLKL